jgi:hypothetical protein
VGKYAATLNGAQCRQGPTLPELQYLSGHLQRAEYPPKLKSRKK